MLEARIAAQRIPDGRELEFPVGDAGRDLGRDGELFEGQIFFPDPGIDQGEVSDIKRPVHRVFGDRKQLAGAFALSNRVRFVRPDLRRSLQERSRQVRIPAGPCTVFAAMCPGGGERALRSAAIAEAACHQPDIPIPWPERIIGRTVCAFRRNKGERLSGHLAITFGKSAIDERESSL